MRVLLTGSRWWSEPRVIYRVLQDLRREHGDDLLVVHGDCPHGADRAAKNWCWEMVVKQEPHPADWSLGKKAGPIRNQQMVDLGADLCIAFPEANSPGTRGCMALAEKAGIPVINYGDPR